MFEYRQIIIRMRQGQSDREIAKSLLAGRSKCQSIRLLARRHGWLEAKTPLPDDARLAQVLSANKRISQKTSSVEPYKETVLAWRDQGVNGTTIHQALVSRFDYSGSYDSIRRFLKKHPITVKATVPLHFEPAEAAQVDFGHGPEIVDCVTGEVIKSWFFVMTLCFSRHMYLELVKDQRVETWLGCHRRAFEFFGGVPGKIIIDNAKCAIIKACRHEPTVQRAYANYAEGYGFIISPCPPREPQMKGRVESGVKYVKGRFLPLRTFRSLTDANRQAKAWVLSEAGNRKHGSTHEKPLTLFEETERYLLKPLPDNAPETASWEQVKVHGDCHVQYAKCRYSVPYRLIGQVLWLKASENVITIYHDHELIAQHIRLSKPGKPSTLNEHLPPNAKAYLMRDPTWCRKQAAEIGEHCLGVIEHLFADKVLDNLRAAQGILSLAKKYGNARVNAACKRAIAFQSLRYMTIKQTLANGLEYDPLPDQKAFDLLGSAYTKGRFIRQSANTQH